MIVPILYDLLDTWPTTYSHSLDAACKSLQKVDGRSRACVLSREVNWSVLSLEHTNEKSSGQSLA